MKDEARDTLLMAGYFPGTLRDWFAGQVLHDGIHHTAGQIFSVEQAQLFAQRCFLLADAMMEERQKPTGQAFKAALHAQDGAEHVTVHRLTEQEFAQRRRGLR